MELLESNITVMSIDTNPSAPMVWGVSTFIFCLIISKEEMETSVGIPEEVALPTWCPYICYDSLLWLLVSLNDPKLYL